MTKETDGEILDILVRHGDFSDGHIKRLEVDRKVTVCMNCIDGARNGDPLKITSCLDEILKLSKMLEHKSVIEGSNCLKICVILNNLINTQGAQLSDECRTHIKSSKTHNEVKLEGSPSHFIKSSSRNKVLVQALQSFSNLSDIELDSVPPKKLERLSLCYETVLNTRNMNVVTLPSLCKNMKLWKTTHHKGVLNEVGYPSGGKYKTVQNVAKQALPELNPPKGDFVSTDDNLQVYFYCLVVFNVTRCKPCALTATVGSVKSAILLSGPLPPD